MRFRLGLTMAAIALLGLALPALAQQRPEGKGRGGPPGGFGGGFGGGMFGGGGGMSRLFLLRIPEIQKELDLVDEQLTAIQKLQEELGGGRGRGGPGGGGDQGGKGRGRGKADSGDKAGASRTVPAEWYFVQQEQKGQRGRGGFGGGQPPTEEERAQFEAQRLERARQEKAKLAEILLPHQMKRLTEIYLQIAGVGALQDEDVAKDLGINDDQKAKLAAVRRENQETMGAQMRELFAGGGGGGDRDANRAKMEEMRKAGDAKILAVLTSEQKAKFEEMKGKKLDLPENALRGGFGGGRGGPGGGPGGTKGGNRGGNNNNNN